MIMSPQDALKKHFGLERFRYPQEGIIESILKREDTLVIMPTGGGKSLCYQLPALLLPGVTLVISPLIALMKDQVDGLKAKKIEAAMINSSQSWPQQQEILGALRAGKLKLLYIAPERFRARSFTDSLRGVEISLVAVDEAHCISQWGHDFRPDYLRLGEALESLGHPLCAAFTATATPEVQKDIRANLRLKSPNSFVSGFSRPNLTFTIRKPKTKLEKYRRIRKLIDLHKTGIVYCATRKSVEEVSEWMKEDDQDHIVYHGGLSDTERSLAQDRFIGGETSVAVATNAFGMGIDRSDIRFVCHYEMPGSIEAFYQEAGRAGRDGKPGFCELQFMYADKRVQDFFIEGGNPDASLIKQTYAHLHSEAGNSYELVMPIDELIYRLGKKTNGMSVSAALGVLRRQGIIERYDVPGSRVRGTRLLQPDTLPGDLILDAAALTEKKRRDESKLKKVIQWAYSQNCREQWILRYFGEMNSKPCGRCDACMMAIDSPARVLDENESVILKKALSGVARMSQRHTKHEWIARFGRDRIIKCLIGSKAKTIVQADLDKLPTWGILKVHSTEFVSELFDAMAQQGLVETNDGEYPLLQLTEFGSRVMFGEVDTELAWPSVLLAAAQTDSDQEAIDYEESLFQALVSKRNELRRQRGNVPAYTIFPNLVLKKLAALKPKTAEEAMMIKGIGPAKAETILPVFLDIVARHEP
jgi:ATP-dependent DNA helicase RecQ